MLNPRVPQPGLELLKIKTVVDGLVNKWNDAAIQKVAAMNHFLDRSLERRRDEFGGLRDKVGACRRRGLCPLTGR